MFLHMCKMLAVYQNISERVNLAFQHVRHSQEVLGLLQV